MCTFCVSVCDRANENHLNMKKFEPKKSCFSCSSREGWQTDRKASASTMHLSLNQSASFITETDENMVDSLQNGLIHSCYATHMLAAIHIFDKLAYGILSISVLWNTISKTAQKKCISNHISILQDTSSIVERHADISLNICCVSQKKVVLNNKRANKKSLFYFWVNSLFMF